MLAVYYIAVITLMIAGILVVIAGGIAIIHVIRHPDDRSVQDLDGPLREYLLDAQERDAANEAVAEMAATVDKR